MCRRLPESREKAHRSTEVTPAMNQLMVNRCHSLYIGTCSCEASSRLSGASAAAVAVAAALSDDSFEQRGTNATTESTSNMMRRGQRSAWPLRSCHSNQCELWLRLAIAAAAKRRTCECGRASLLHLSCNAVGSLGSEAGWLTQPVMRVFSPSQVAAVCLMQRRISLSGSHPFRRPSVARSLSDASPRSG